MATGSLRAHHARRRRRGAICCCARRDPRKDQTDFLWPLTQAQLAAARFPDRRADQGRGAGASARALGPGHRRQAREPGDLLHPRRRLPRLPAPPRARRRSGRGRSSIGGAACSARTAGSPSYTVGQRRGLGLATGRAALRDRSRSRAQHRGGRRSRRPRDATGSGAEQVNFIACAPPAAPLRVDGEDPAQPRAGAGDDRAAGGPGPRPRCASTRPAARGRARASRWCSTRATWSSAAA